MARPGGNVIELEIGIGLLIVLVALLASMGPDW
jgi:hypothetical protein